MIRTFLPREYFRLVCPEDINDFSVELKDEQIKAFAFFLRAGVPNFLVEEHLRAIGHSASEIDEFWETTRVICENVSREKPGIKFKVYSMERLDGDWINYDKPSLTSQSQLDFLEFIGYDVPVSTLINFEKRVASISKTDFRLLARNKKKTSPMVEDILESLLVTFDLKIVNICQSDNLRYWSITANSGKEEITLVMPCDAYPSVREMLVAANAIISSQMELL